jgi:protein TonB
MVAATVIGEDKAVRWLGYLTASSCLVFALATYIELAKPQPVLSVPQVLKVSLKTLAAPKQVVEVAAAPVAPVQTVQPKAPPVVTQKQAVKKVAPIQKHEPVKPAPVVAKVQPKLVEKVVPPAKPTPPKPVLKTDPKPQPVVKKTPAPKTVSPVETTTNNKGKDKATVIQNASYRKQVPPVYPRRAFDLGQQGVVMLHAEVMPNGKPKTLKVFKSSGHRLLDKAALSAVKKWEFETDPTQVTWVSVPVRFVIN